MGSRFTVRVMLKGDPPIAWYTHLHKEMQNLGFVRYLSMSDGKTVTLPHAEYNYVGEEDYTPEAVYNHAAKAIRSVNWWQGAEVLVTKSEGRFIGTVSQ